jgi:hypothetical protein
LAGYFTADVTRYTRGVVSIAAAILPACRALCEARDHEIGPELAAHIDELVAVTLAGAVYAAANDRHEAVA